MSGDWVTDDIDHGTRVVAGVEVRIREERWRYGGSSFSVYRVSDDRDLTQEVHGQCFDLPPTDDQIATLLDGPREQGVRLVPNHWDQVSPRVATQMANLLDQFLSEAARLGYKVEHHPHINRPTPSTGATTH